MKKIKILFLAATVGCAWFTISSFNREQGFDTENDFSNTPPPLWISCGLLS